MLHNLLLCSILLVGGIYCIVVPDQGYRGDYVASAEKEYCLLYGGAYAIKDYYMESGNPRQMRGASELLNESASEAEKYLLHEDVKPENIIKSGASLSAKIPKHKAETFVKKFEYIFRANCRTASAAFVAVPFEDDYQKTKANALAEYNNRRSSKFTSWRFQNSPDDGYLLNKKIKSDLPLDEQPAVERIPDEEAGFKRLSAEEELEHKRCDRCRLRFPLYRIKYANGEGQFLCTSCAKREKSSNNRKYDFKKMLGDGFDYNEPVNTIADLADGNGRFALLYADVNNLGGHSESINTFEKDRYFHCKMKNAVENAVSGALLQVMELTGKNEGKKGKLSAVFEIITLGGDDICLLLPGDVALLTAKTIADKFDECFKNEDTKFTISAAVCVANETAAISYMENIVNNLLKDAKKFARETSRKGVNEAAYPKAQSVVNISFLEKRSGLFPMTADDVEAFTRLLSKTASFPSSVIRNIAEARREMLFDEEFALFFNYLLSHKTHFDKKEVFVKIYNTYAGKKPWEDFVIWRSQKLGKEEASNARD